MDAFSKEYCMLSVTTTKQALCSPLLDPPPTLRKHSGTFPYVPHIRKP